MGAGQGLVLRGAGAGPRRPGHVPRGGLRRRHHPPPGGGRAAPCPPERRGVPRRRRRRGPGPDRPPAGRRGAGPPAAQAHRPLPRGEGDRPRRHGQRVPGRAGGGRLPQGSGHQGRAGRPRQRLRPPPVRGGAPDPGRPGASGHRAPVRRRDHGRRAAVLRHGVRGRPGPPGLLRRAAAAHRRAAAPVPPRVRRRPARAPGAGGPPRPQAVQRAGHRGGRPQAAGLRDREAAHTAAAGGRRRGHLDHGPAPHPRLREPRTRAGGSRDHGQRRLLARGDPVRAALRPPPVPPGHAAPGGAGAGPGGAGPCGALHGGGPGRAPDAGGGRRRDGDPHPGDGERPAGDRARPSCAASSAATSTTSFSRRCRRSRPAATPRPPSWRTTSGASWTAGPSWPAPTAGRTAPRSSCGGTAWG